MSDKFLKHKLKNIEELKKNNDNYITHFDDNNINIIYVYLKAPKDSVYSYTFLKLKLDITNFPLQAPIVTFINYQNSIRIHPNLYGSGKVCLSILGTYSGPSWNPLITLDNLLITIQAILDNTPMIHEPNQKNNIQYNEYIRYTSIDFLLLNYLEKEENDIFKNYIIENIKLNHTKILEILDNKDMKVERTLHSPSKFLDYSSLKNKYLEFYAKYS